MLLEKDVPKDRQIQNFTRPYDICCTPYYKVEFSKITREVCADETQKNSFSNLKICKIIVLGDLSVGKSSIVNRLCKKLFDTAYKSTIGVDFEVERYQILGFNYNLQIWDTAGQERFKSIAQSYYRNSHVIILVFDLSNLSTLRNCRQWFLEAMSVSGSMLPYVFLVGTKKDLLGTFAYKNAELNAMNMAKSITAEYWPVSSKTGENIDDLFSRIAVLTFDDCIKNEFGTQKKVIVGDNITALTKSTTKRDARNKCGFLKCKKS